MLLQKKKYNHLEETVIKKIRAIEVTIQIKLSTKMNEQSKKTELIEASDKLKKELQPDIYNNQNKTETYQEIEKDLNSKILKITMDIKDNYPELSKYLEEMPVTIPDEQNPDITLKNLSSYYDSLNSLLNKYNLEQSQNNSSDSTPVI